MEKELNTMVFCKEDYASEDDMWNDISTVLRILARKYIAVVRCDEPGLGIYVIEYNYANYELGGAMPVWLTPEERELIWTRDA